MKEQCTDFLGSRSGKFDSDFCTVSVVSYESPVSEEWHFHNNFHLSAILRGGNLESRKSADIQVLPGKLLVYPQGEIHRNRFTEFPSKNLNLEIKDTFFKECDLKPGEMNFTRHDTICSYFNLIKIYRELMINDQYTRDTIHISLRSMFSKKENTKAKPPWLKKLHEIIEDQWDKFVPLQELASELQVHPVTVSKYFRTHYHCTLADYLRKIKVEKALHLILHTNKSATEIAFICGFSDQSHMTRLFRFYVGFTPKEISRI